MDFAKIVLSFGLQVISMYPKATAAELWQI
jgi:hypothetical protein